MTLARKIFFSMILNKTYTFEQIVYKMHNEWEREANKIAERDGVTNRNEVENHSDEEWFKAMCKPNARELILDALEKSSQLDMLIVLKRKCVMHTMSE